MLFWVQLPEINATIFKYTEIKAVTSIRPPVPPPVSCCLTGQLWAQWATYPQHHPSPPQAPGKRGMSMSLRTCAITSYTNCKCWRTVTVWEWLLISLLVSHPLLTFVSYPAFKATFFKYSGGNERYSLLQISFLLWQSTSHIPYPWPGSFEGQTNGEPGGLRQKGGGGHVRVS